MAHLASDTDTVEFTNGIPFIRPGVHTFRESGGLQAPLRIDVPNLGSILSDSFWTTISVPRRWCRQTCVLVCV